MKIMFEMACIHPAVPKSGRKKLDLFSYLLRQMHGLCKQKLVENLLESIRKARVF
jgi:hypothetical protein